MTEMLAAARKVVATWDSLDSVQAPDTGDIDADVGPYRDAMDAAISELRAVLEAFSL